MFKFVEMDKNVTINDQIEEERENKNRDSVILINKFDVPPDKIEQFLEDWAETSSLFKQQPGFISTQLHKGIGKSSVFLNYAVWESLEQYKNALDNVVGSDMIQSQLSKYPDSLVVSPHLFKKVAVPGICVE